jgi:4-hydroxybenzoate polyprenyltransferase
MNRLRIFLEMIKFEHTVFALPFAYLGMMMAAGGIPGIDVFLWTTVAMVAARTLAMAANRLVDRKLDARNPRTADRALPKGLLEPWVVVTACAVSLLVFEFAAWRLNPFVFALSPFALIFLLGYHYTKRFTWTCHWVLGFTDGIAAAGGWAAVRGTLDPPAFVLWLAVTVWIAGFDLIYSCQDVDIDRREGLYSVPSRFGVGFALRLAKIQHALAIAALIAAGVMTSMTWPYWIGVAAATILIVYENSVVKEHDLSRLDFAFFNINGYISLTLFTGTLCAVLLL